MRILRMRAARNGKRLAGADAGLSGSGTGSASATVDMLIPVSALQRSAARLARRDQHRRAALGAFYFLAGHFRLGFEDPGAVRTRNCDVGLRGVGWRRSGSAA